MNTNTLSILFINPCLREDAKRRYVPVGLACILTAVKKAGFAFDLLDLDATPMTTEEIDYFLCKKKYDVVGLGCIVTGLSTVIDLAKRVRKHSPECTIIAGNSVATSIPELLLKNSEVNIASLGEGDVTIVQLLQAIAHKTPWEATPGIAYLHEGTVLFSPKRSHVPNLDTIGFPDWHLFNLAAYNNRDSASLTVSNSQKGQVVFPLNGARGCPFDCTFCYHVFKGEKYRAYSDVAIKNEFIRLTQEFGATFIYFWDELSFPSIPKVEGLIRELETLPFVTEWEGVSRTGLFSKNDTLLLQRMKRVGCQSIAFSIENASPEILKAMNKKTSHDHTVEHALALWRAEITPLTSLIFGYPQETEHTIKATLDLCEACNIYPSVGFLQPLPGTPMYQYCLDHKFITNELDYLCNSGDRQDFHVNLTTIPTDEFIHMVTEGLHTLAKKLGLEFKNPLKTGVYQKPKTV